MNYSFDDARPVLARTPQVLHTLLDGLPACWTHASEGTGTWSPFDVVGHLIHGERTDWIPRVEHILQYGDTQPFPAFDREAMLADASAETLHGRLETFAALRRESLVRLDALRLSSDDLDRVGLHPALGRVTMRQHLATWVAHDLSHIAQVVRTMATQYADAVGPWRAYLSVLERAPR